MMAITQGRTPLFVVRLVNRCCDQLHGKLQLGTQKVATGCAVESRMPRERHRELGPAAPGVATNDEARDGVENDIIGARRCCDWRPQELRRVCGGAATEHGCGENATIGGDVGSYDDTWWCYELAMPEQRRERWFCVVQW